MAMRLFILADGELREMSAHRIVNEFKQGGAIVAASFFVVFWLEAPEIRDEIGLPHAPAFDFREVTTAPPPLVGSATVAIGKDKRIIVDVFQVSVAVDHHGGIGE